MKRAALLIATVLLVAAIVASFLAWKTLWMPWRIFAAQHGYRPRMRRGGRRQEIEALTALVTSATALYRTRAIQRREAPPPDPLAGSYSRRVPNLTDCEEIPY